MTNDKLPTLASEPRLYIRTRANRLARLIQINAPTIILEGEFRLIEQAMDALRKIEGDTREEMILEWDKVKQAVKEHKA